MTAAAVAWHDAENGSYEADLPVWRELAESAGGPVLDLGAGTGRVALDLVARGHEVTALDRDPDLLAALRRRDASVPVVIADARSFELDGRFPLILAPMQLVQILDGAEGRAAMLERVRDHLLPGGTVAVAVADPREALPGADPAPPLPDMLERDGWVYSSQPVDVRAEGGQVLVERLRQAVSPAGELNDERVVIALDAVSPDRLEDEARAAGLDPYERRAVPETLDHIGSTVVLCRR